jgi:hypothetical protein
MHNATIIEFARQLLVVHGAKATEEALVHERICMKYGAERTAETWRNVQTALEDLKGKCLTSAHPGEVKITSPIRIRANQYVGANPHRQSLQLWRDLL